jgi:hypothetical protein
MRRATVLLGMGLLCAGLSVGCGGDKRTHPEPIPGNTGKANPKGAVGKPQPARPPSLPKPPGRGN